MNMADVDMLRLEVSCDETAPARVRRELKALEGIEPMRDDVLLVASELVTNAVLHSGSARGDSIEVLVSRLDGCVRITVEDPGVSGLAARPRDGSGAESVGGWGLRLVTQLARQWGAERNGGQRVWAELAF